MHSPRRLPPAMVLLGAAILLGMAAAAVMLIQGVPDGPGAAAPAWPRSMASLGDSISRATNVCCRYGDAPEHAWSTGSAERDGVRSHYQRILAAEEGLRGRAHNLARSGARVADLPGQAEQAVEQGAEYVTVLVGANDACTSSRRTMTTVREFHRDVRSALDILTTGLPDARILVASIPNTHRLWELYGSDPLARSVWEMGRICPSMLSAENTEEDRQVVLDRLRAFNDVLARVCGRHLTCRFDDHAVFQFRFDREHVSTLDYFHPSLAGQAELASLTWKQGWWAGA